MSAAAGLPAGAQALGDVALRHNWTIGRTGLRGEILHEATRAVWLCQEPVTKERFATLAMPEGFTRLGIGSPVADAAYFRRSPGAAQDGAVDVITVDGCDFAFVAVPGERERGHDHAMVLAVDKHHSIWFAAGRTIEVLDMGDGRDYLPQTSADTRLRGTERRLRTLAPAWSIREVTLATDLLVEVPNPARVCFLSDGSSFQGPVEVDLP